MKLDERVLLMPLGDWEKNVTPTWTWFYSEEEDAIYKRDYYGINSMLYEDNNDGELRRDCTNAPLLCSAKSIPTYSLWQTYLKDPMWPYYSLHVAILVHDQVRLGKTCLTLP